MDYFVTLGMVLVGTGFLLGFFLGAGAGHAVLALLATLLLTLGGHLP